MKALDDHAVLEKEDLYWIHSFELFHAISIGDDSLFFSDKIELFDPARQNDGINLFWKIISIIGGLVIKVIIDSLFVKFAFLRLTIFSNPFEPVITEELLHFFCPLLVFVSIYPEFTDLF